MRRFSSGKFSSREITEGRSTKMIACETEGDGKAKRYIERGRESVREKGIDARGRKERHIKE